MCAWTVSPISPFDESIAVEFDVAFETHMMDGDLHDGSHRGLHSLYRKISSGGGYRVVSRVNDTACTEIFSAKVELRSGIDRRGEDEFGAQKLSSFFPNDMGIDLIKRAVEYAFRNYHGRRQGLIRRKPKHTSDESFSAAKTSVMDAHTSHMNKLNVNDDAGTKWAGLVRFNKGANGYNIVIGSPQKGTNSSKILTAYPTIRGKFL